MSSFTLPTHLPFPPFYHSKLLPYFHLTPRTFKQSPVNHSRNNVVRFVSFSRVSTVRPSGKVPNRHRRSRDTRACCISSVPVLSSPPFLRTQSSSSTRHKLTTVSVDSQSFTDRPSTLTVDHRACIARELDRRFVESRANDTRTIRIEDSLVKSRRNSRRNCD